MTTINQIKIILKQVLLLFGLVYLLSGRSNPGVSESTSVQFNSLCVTGTLGMANNQPQKDIHP